MDFGFWILTGRGKWKGKYAKYVNANQVFEEKKGGIINKSSSPDREE